MNDAVGNALGSGLGLIFAIGMYVLMALPIYTVAQKTNQENAWFAFVPILNIILLIQCADKELWYIVLFLIPCVNFILYAYLWAEVATRLNKSSTLGWLCLIPGLNAIMPFIIAFA